MSYFDWVQYDEPHLHERLSLSENCLAPHIFELAATIACVCLAIWLVALSCALARIRRSNARRLAGNAVSWRALNTIFLIISVHTFRRQAATLVLHITLVASSPRSPPPKPPPPLPLKQHDERPIINRSKSRRIRRTNK